MAIGVSKLVGSVYLLLTYAVKWLIPCIYVQNVPVYKPRTSFAVTFTEGKRWTL